MTGTEWTEEELRILEEKYPKTTARELAKTLDRSKESIYIKASQMNIESKREWKPREIEFIKKSYGIKSVDEIAEELERKIKEVENKIDEIDLSPRQFGEEERRKVKNIYKEGKDVDSIAEDFNLTLDLVMEIVCPKKEIQRLYSEEDLFQREIAERLGVTQSYISKRMKELDIDTRSNDPWTQGQEDLLEDKYLELSKEELLSLFPNRSWEGIKCKALKLGVARSAEVYRKSDEVTTRLRKMAEENKVRVDFDKDRELAYILGVIDGDGFHNNKNTVGLEVSSAEFADKFKNTLEIIGLNPGRGQRTERSRETVWATSTELVRWCMDMNYEKKEDWLKDSDERAWKYIEGMYESDGNFHKSTTARICSYDAEEKRFLSRILKWLGIGCNIHQNNVYVRSKYANKFFRNINPIIRKKKVCEVS